jgi:flagellar hook-associated protein 1 FlgK
MLGLHGTLNLGVRSLQTQSQGLAVAGQNLANVHNPTYTRQRLLVQTTTPLQGTLGSQGTGVGAQGIQQVLNTLLDRQIQSETSVSGFWEAHRTALELAQTNLAETLDSRTQTAAGTAAAGEAGAASTLAHELSVFFNEWQNLAAAPASLAQRSTLLARAQSLAAQFQQTGARLGQLNHQLNEAIDTDVAQANEFLTAVARLNDQIQRAELGRPGSANDLRDLRRQKIEALATLANVDTAETPDGQLTLSAGGVQLVAGRNVLDTLAGYDDASGQRLVRTATTATPLTLTAGRLAGTVDARDGPLATLRHELDTLAATLIREVNTRHRPGFNLNGQTGADFFAGTDAASIRVAPALIADPALLQASGAAGAAGDNQVALALAQLAQQPQADLGNLTFASAYTRSVTSLGEALANAGSQVEDQQVLASFLASQRSSVSGVSIDEEMTDLVKFQKAFQASARIITTVDEMLDEVINLKR